MTKKNKHEHKHPLLDKCSCKRSCIDKLPEVQRKNIHTSFWELEYNEQKIWVFQHVIQSSPKQANPNNSGTAQKAVREYWMPSAKGEQVTVCKHMFMSTLGYTADKFITTALNTTTNFGVTAADKRGKHKPKHAMTDAQKETAERHIKSFNPQISHYRREHAPNRLYLPSELSKQEMFEDYLNIEREPDEKPLSYCKYARLVSDLNISFAKLGDEECEMCETHKIHLREVRKTETRDKSEDRKKDYYSSKSGSV